MDSARGIYKSYGKPNQNNLYLMAGSNQPLLVTSQICDAVNNICEQAGIPEGRLQLPTGPVNS